MIPAVVSFRAAVAAFSQWRLQSSPFNSFRGHLCYFFPPEREALQPATFDPNQLSGQLTSLLLLNSAEIRGQLGGQDRTALFLKVKQQ